MPPTPPRSAWTASAVARHIGVAASTVSGWISSDLVEPARRGRGRRGHDLGYSGLLEALAVRDLLRSGFAPRDVRRAVSNLRGLTAEDRPLSRVCLVVIDDDVFIRDGEDEEALVSVLRHPAQRVMLLRIGREHAAVTEALATEASVGESVGVPS